MRKLKGNITTTPIEIVGFDIGGVEVRTIVCREPVEEPKAIRDLQQASRVTEIVRGTDKTGFATVWER